MHRYFMKHDISAERLSTQLEYTQQWTHFKDTVVSEVGRNSQLKQYLKSLNSMNAHTKHARNTHTHTGSGSLTLSRRALRGDTVPRYLYRRDANKRTLKRAIQYGISVSRSTFVFKDRKKGVSHSRNLRNDSNKQMSKGKRVPSRYSRRGHSMLLGWILKHGVVSADDGKDNNNNNNNNNYNYNNNRFVLRNTRSRPRIGLYVSASERILPSYRNSRRRRRGIRTRNRTRAHTRNTLMRAFANTGTRHTLSHSRSTGSVIRRIMRKSKSDAVLLRRDLRRRKGLHRSHSRLRFRPFVIGKFRIDQHIWQGKR